MYKKLCSARGLLTALFISLALTMMAQVDVTGTVTDDTGEPVIGALVKEKGNEKAAAMTDIDGNFSLKVKNANSTIEVTYVGMNPAEVKLGGRTHVDIQMSYSSTALQEVVAIGYGTSRKVDITGSVASVSEETLHQGIAANADQMLAGKIPGVQVTANSGAPGAATSIRIRGASSINSSNEPLYIIDGVQMSGAAGSIGGFNWSGDGESGQTTASNPLAGISPNDIVSIDVLKDASATAIYGAAGANGVIIITTRRGKAGRTTVSFDGYVAWQQTAKRLKMMDLKEYATYQKSLYEEGSAFELNNAYRDPELLGKGTDWQDEIFRTAFMQSYQLQVSGGTDKITFAASGGYMNQDGIIIGSDFNRFNSRFSVDTNFTEWLKLGGQLAYTRTNETITLNDGASGIIMQAMTMQPDVPVYDFQGNYASPSNVNGSSTWNPVALALQKNNTLLRQNVTGNFYGEVKFLKDFTFRAEYGYIGGSSLNKSFIPRIYEGVTTPIEINQIYQNEEDNYFWVQKDYVTYHKLFDQKHDVTVMAGFEASKSSWEGWNLVKKNLSFDDIHVIGSDGEFVKNEGWKDEVTTASYFGRFNYGFDNRYLLTFTMRADGSSKFAKGNKWGYFPSVALAWRASQEKFLSNVEWLNNLKLRLGYGQVGNSNIDPYMYGTTLFNVQSPQGSSWVINNLANKDLKWEASEQYNVGLDLSVLNNRIELTVDGYYKQTKDLLLRVVAPSYTGITSDRIKAPFANIGKVRNIGVEVALNTRNIITNDFQWTSNLTMTHNKNKVVKLNNKDQVLWGSIYWYPAFANATMIAEGQPMGVFYGYETDGIFKNAEEILAAPVQVPDDNNPNINKVNQTSGVWPGDVKFKDRDGDGKITPNDQTVIGDPNPDLTFGFTNTFYYKGFDLNVVLTGSIGGDILNFTRWKTESLNNLWDNQSKDVLDRAQFGYYDGNPANQSADNVYIVNPGASCPRFNNLGVNQNDRASDRYIEDGSYLRIQNISLGYTLPEKWVKKVLLTQARLYFNVQNVHTFTKYSGFDPEIGAFNQSALMQNIDMGRYPTPRTYTLGMTLTF